jgi:ABC-type lipoprotein export system ATPase subunit
MSEDQVLLQAENIHKSYRMGDTKLEVLKGIDLSVKQGEFLSVVGSSGSGKSTLLHILGALDSPDVGKVIFEQQDVTALSRSRLNKYRNLTVGFVFQFYHLLNELTVLENVYLPAMACRSAIKWLACREKAKERARNLLDQFKMSHRLKHRPHQLSGG